MSNPQDEREALSQDPIERAIDDYVEDYEMIGEAEDGRDACYTPNANDRALLKDAIMGLLADDVFCAALANQRAATTRTPQDERARQLAEDWHEGVPLAERNDWCNEAAGLLLHFAELANQRAEAASESIVVEVQRLGPALERLRGMTPPDAGETWEEQWAEINQTIERLEDMLTAQPEAAPPFMQEIAACKANPGPLGAPATIGPLPEHAPEAVPQGGQWTTGLGLAVIGRRHFGNPIPQAWYVAAKELLGHIAAAPPSPQPPVAQAMVPLTAALCDGNGATGLLLTFRHKCDAEAVMRMVVNGIGTAKPAQIEPEAGRPDILERLTYHALERDDLTLNECLDFLANEWRKVRGRSDRQMVMQILALLAEKPAPERVALTPLTERQIVDCLIASGCTGNVKMTYDSGPYEITRTSVNSDRLAKAVIAKFCELNGITAPAGGGEGV